jgi:hypothetical protein
MREPDDLFENEPELVTVTEEGVRELSFLLDDTLEFEGKLYAVLYPYDPEQSEILDDKVFFVLDEDDTLSAVNTDEILQELELLYDLGDVPGMLDDE